jgi:hypothetical protein
MDNVSFLATNLEDYKYCFPIEAAAGKPEPEFVNVQEAQESIPPAYVACRAGTSNRFVEPARQAGNRFLGSLQGLQIRASIPVLFRYYPNKVHSWASSLIK